MKYYIFLLFLFIVGCGPTTDNKFKFHYKDRVIITDGFYKDEVGIVKSEHGFYYSIELEDGTRILAHKDCLKKVEE